jgi:hypothetical protein
MAKPIIFLTSLTGFAASVLEIASAALLDPLG